MSLADEMRAATKEGTKEQLREKERKYQEEKLRHINLENLAKELTPEYMAKVIERARQRAALGEKHICYYVGEAADYVYCLSRYLKEALEKEDFKVEISNVVQRPVGSDPGRWDTYTEVYLDIKW